MDLKDPQWHACRDAFPLLAPAAGIFLVLSNLLQVILRHFTADGFRKSQWRCRFYIAFGLVFMVVLHDASVVKPVVFIVANFLLATALGKIWFAPYVTWSYSILCLMCVNAGYCRNISWVLGDPSWLVSVDSRTGLYPWSTCFNLMMLRMQSYNMDYWWALRRTERADAATSYRTDGVSVMKLEARLPTRYYEVFEVYAGYVVYSPLYIAGPIITFEKFLSQLLTRPEAYNLKDKFLYAVRLVAAVLVLEVQNHFLYVGAITHMSFRHSVRTPEGGEIALLEYLASVPDKDDVDLGTIVLYSHWMLIFLWLKFLIIWRFFRLWSLLDNVCPPENMKKCVNSNYSVAGFWRAWHCSFNEWLIRYVYIPLGGSKGGSIRQLINVFVVFTFVALWHDIESKLLVWSGAFTLFSIPHILGSRLVQTAAYRRFAASHENLTVLLFAIGASGSILMLKTANVIGFALGVEGVTLLRSKASLGNFLPFLAWYATLITANAMVSRMLDLWKNLKGKTKLKS